MALPKGTRTPVFAVRASFSYFAALAPACPRPRVWPARAYVHRGRAAPHSCWARAALVAGLADEPELRSVACGLRRDFCDWGRALGLNQARRRSRRREGAQVVATLHTTLASMESKIPGEPAAQRG